MVSKNKRKMKNMSRKRVSRKNQKGGVAYTFDHSCRVGGLPSRVSISECPNKGPLDPCHMKQMYGQSCKQAGGSKRSNKSNKKVKKSRRNKSSSGLNKRVNKSKKNMKKKASSKK